MSTVQSIPGASQYKKYAFTYRFEGADCCIEIPALSLEEAKERVKVLSFARYDGEVVPVRRRSSTERRPNSWFRSALRSA